MKVPAILLLAFIASAVGKEQGTDKEKRGVVQYTTPKTYATASTSPDVAYATAKVSPQTFTSEKEATYIQPQYQQAIKYTQTQNAPVAYQHQYEYEQQAYEQPSVTKLTPAKVQYAAAPAAPAPIHYSLASDVSSFSYNSPLVAYSNLGLLKQALGNAAAAQQAQVAYQHAPQQVQYTSPKVAYATAPQQVQQVAYATAPQKVSYAVPQKIAYAAVPQKVQYVAAPQKVAYTAVPQKVAYAAPQQVEYTKAVPQVAYASDAQKVVYQTAPQYTQQVAYASAPQQAYEQQPVVYTAQQLAYAQQQYQQQLQHQHAASQLQPVYVSQPQPQYVTASKYANTGVTYA